MFSSELFHYGTKRHSGRYPYGSGENPFQHEGFLRKVSELKDNGLSEKEIAEFFDISTTTLRDYKTLARAKKRAEDSARALELKDKGYSNTKIGDIMGINESSVRNLLKPALNERSNVAINTAEALKKSVGSKNYIDVGSGVEKYVGVSETKFRSALTMLKAEGYKVYYIQVEQASNPGKYTSIKVLAPPGTEYRDLYLNKHKIKPIQNFTVDDGKTFLGIKPPVSIDSKRIKIRYGDEDDNGVSGSDMDGVIQLRRGVKDLSLGNANYAQVRIAVDGTHYLKGMALYSDNLPKGVDIIYNTNKKTGTPKEKVFKELSSDPDNPFGATIKAGGQHEYTDSKGEKKLSAINIVNEEGDWFKWSKTLSSQMLSKQDKTLIEKQLTLSYADKKLEFETIKNLTNPAVKKKLLESFADDCDASAVHLKAAALPRQSSKVILPIPSLKDNEIYAPGYNNGETVVLIRHPHGGIFEIPTLKVNNKHDDAKKTLGNAIDAVGINSSVAERLSGADFDGDTVLVIPVNSRVKVNTAPPLKGLKNFDPKEAYPGYEGMKVISNSRKQTEMGKVSNLITDMTIKGASEDEIERAVKHSMVVIDAEKHKLDYKKSFEDNKIAELKQIYQGGSNKGASTLISKAKSVEYVDARKDFSYRPGNIDPKTGEKIYEKTGESYTNSAGKEVTRKQKSTKMAEAKDARELSSGYIQEELYARYANGLKALGNEARKEWLNTPSVERSPSAAKTYEEEVHTLNAKLSVAEKNAPRERQAQLIANHIVETKVKSNPELKDRDHSSELKKVRSQALASARSKVGAKKEPVQITDKEWEAIQAGAVSNNVLMKILNNTDLDDVKKKAMPKQTNAMTPAQKNKILTMNRTGYTIAEIAEAMGVSTSTVSKIIAPTS